MLDVSQIMKDLASMIHEQGDAIGKTLRVCVALCLFNIVYIAIPISKVNLCGHVLIWCAWLITWARKFCWEKQTF